MVRTPSRHSFQVYSSSVFIFSTVQQHLHCLTVLAVSLWNTLSIAALAAKLGFRRIGSKIDELDGPEEIFERLV